MRISARVLGPIRSSQPQRPASAVRPGTLSPVLSGSRWVVGVLVVAAAAVLPPSVMAQFPPAEPVSQEDRTRLYDDLARDVAALERQSSILKRVVKLVRPAVVHIEVRKGRRSASARVDDPADETGSGVLFGHRDRTFVLSNRHLIRYADVSEVIVTLADGRQLKPSRAWNDAGTDVAVMEVAGRNLAVARVGNSDAAEIGDFVLALGSPFGLSHSVTYGIISAKGRRDLELATDGVYYQDFLQIDASINPGNSGGPLVNLRGEVIGINTAIASTSGRNEGIGFSIPINMAMIVARQLIDRGVVVRGFLGVNLDSRFGADAASRIGLDRPRGARVTGVTAGSPAEAAQIETGDVIVRFNSVWIENDSHLVNQVSLTEVNIDVPLLVFRGGKTVELTVRVGDRSQLQSP